MNRVVVAVAAVGAVWAGGFASAQCPPYWDTRWGDAIGSVRAAIMHDDGTGPALYVGGLFHRIGIPPTGSTLPPAIRTVAKRGATAWEPLLPGLGAPGGLQPGYVYALASFRGELYAGGQFHQLYTGPGNPNPNPEFQMRNIARWNGAEWRPAGLGTSMALSPSNGTGVYALHVHDDGSGEALYMGGYFTHIDATFSPGLARWDGQSWSSISLNDPGVWVRDMVTFDADGAGPNPAHLYVGGNFDVFNGVSAHGLARWDGSTWSAVPGWVTTYSPDIMSLCVFDDDGAGPNPARLFVGGHLHDPNNDTGNQNVAAWNGTQWTFPVAIPFGVGSGAYVTAMTTAHADGEEVLYLGTELWSFQGYSGFEAGFPYSIIRFDGQTTTTVGGGIWGGPPTDPEYEWPPILSGIYAMTEVPTARGPALFVGGGFGALDGGAVTVRNMALWAPTGLPADFNNSGSVSVQDIFDFLGAYFNGDLTADFNASGDVTVQDIFDFLGAYFGGC